MNGFKKFINEQENLDEDFRKLAIKVATPFVIAGSMMGGPAKSQAQDTGKKQPIVMAFDQEAGKMVKTPMNQATFDPKQKKWIKSSDNKPTNNQPQQSNTQVNKKPNKIEPESKPPTPQPKEETPTKPKEEIKPSTPEKIDISIPQGGDYEKHDAIQYSIQKKMNPQGSSKEFYDMWRGYGDGSDAKEERIRNWLKKTPIQEIHMLQLAWIAEYEYEANYKKNLIDKQTFDKLYELHFKPYTKSLQVDIDTKDISTHFVDGGRENWLGFARTDNMFFDYLRYIRDLGVKKFGYKKADFPMDEEKIKDNIGKDYINVTFNLENGQKIITPDKKYLIYKFDNEKKANEGYKNLNYKEDLKKLFNLTEEEYLTAWRSGFIGYGITLKTDAGPVLYAFDISKPKFEDYKYPYKQ
jgi:hypothetical protein